MVLASLDAARQRGRSRSRRRELTAGPEPAEVPTTRATVIAVHAPLADEAAARAWLRTAGEDELQEGLGVLGRLLHAHRLVTADPHVGGASRDRLIVARIGYGAGEEVSDGRWSHARELSEPGGVARRVRRRRILGSEAQLAARLSGLDPGLVGEELVLRARLDLDSGRPREAALQLLIALDVTIAELGRLPADARLTERITALRGQREAAAAAAQAALSGCPSPDATAQVAATVRMIEAAFSARGAADAPSRSASPQSVPGSAPAPGAG